MINDSLIETVFTKFEKFRSIPDEGEDIFTHWNFQDFQDKQYLNFTVDTSDLYALSIMIENYAVKHRAPLLAAFEEEGRFKYVEDRYVKIMRKVPKTWVIGNFNNPFLAQNLPQSVSVVSCIGTPLKTVWAVITRNSNGPIGLVAEEIGDKKFRGFFSTKPEIVKHAVDIMGDVLVTEFDLMKDDYEFEKGGY
uniref:Uncharacterized protein n=1 Tax=uncultured marine thaumarchaeote KM3_105_E03 TaxID=1455981 RepID=A0A075G660_9ARCH|nr:hypothetical protein [uncultured marine thaumarchaeote KM3_105_E03]